jgi:hypothetical protein
MHTTAALPALPAFNRSTTNSVARCQIALFVAASPIRAAIWPFGEFMKDSCRRNDGGLLLMRSVFLAAVCVLAGGPAYAQPVELGDEALKQTVVGKTVNLDTPFGVSIPITYHGNGLMSGKAGILESFLGAQADRGRWWVANGKLCQKWFRWLDAEPSCMQLKQDGNKILWRRDDGLSGTATIASAPPPEAEAAPHGLGGPIPSPKLGASLVAAERPESMASASAIAFPAEVRKVSKPTAPRPVASAAAPALRPPPVGMGAEPRPSATHEPLSTIPLPMAPEHQAHAGLGDQWCHAIVSSEAAADAPQLVLVARLPYGDGELPSPANACLAAEPPLQHLARTGIDAR